MHTPIVILLITLTLSLSVAAQDRGRGWQWYEEVPLTQKVEPERRVQTVTSQPKAAPKTATEQLDTWQAAFLEAKAAAVMHPTVENVHKLQQLIDESWVRSEKLEAAWQQVQLKYPELDYNAQHPTGERAKRQFFERKDAAIEATLKQLAREGAGLFFVFNHDDVYLKEYATQVNAFANAQGLSLLGISMDGSALPEIDTVRQNNGKLKVAVTPAIILVNPTRHTQVAVSYGIKSIEDVKRHIHFVETGYKDTP
ncbi:conjugal transfer protein TraF [Vibrio splendidus]|uniref:conjugal transfer protein TraF n=1 Tax=Vibrio splendidus TaxID=29497 RepID=UPI003D0C5B35